MLFAEGCIVYYQGRENEMDNWLIWILEVRTLQMQFWDMTDLCDTKLLGT